MDADGRSQRVDRIPTRDVTVGDGSLFRWNELIEKDQRLQRESIRVTLCHRSALERFYFSIDCFSMSSPKRVLFVCMGNICRSPTGEGVMRHLVMSKQLDHRVHIDSAGTIGYHAGSPADARMQKSAARRGYALESRARRVTDDDLSTFDLVIAMDRENLHDLRSMDRDPQVEIRLLSDFLSDEWPIDVPDPYYGGEAGFEQVLDMIEQACPMILESLLESNSKES